MPTQPQDLLEYTGYSQEQIYNTAEFVANKVSDTVITRNGHHLSAAKRKYAKANYRAVSKKENPSEVDLLVDP